MHMLPSPKWEQWRRYQHTNPFTNMQTAFQSRIYPSVDAIVRSELLHGLLDRSFLVCKEEAIETEIPNVIDCREQMHVEREQQQHLDRELARREREEREQLDRELARREREQLDREQWRIEFPQIVQLQLRRFRLEGESLRAASGAPDHQGQRSATLRGSHDE